MDAFGAARASVSSAKIERADSDEVGSSRLPMGLKLMIAFFWFGAAMCLPTLAALAFPDGVLEPIWQLKPEARTDFQSMGPLAFLLMSVVGSACALAAIGLTKRAPWGWRLAIAVLTVNLFGDATTALLRYDYPTLIGLPIGGAMILYLWRIKQNQIRSILTTHTWRTKASSQ